MYLTGVDPADSDSTDGADVLALVDAICEFRGVAIENLREMEVENAAERGGVEERIVLDVVRE